MPADKLCAFCGIPPKVEGSYRSCPNYNCPAHDNPVYETQWNWRPADIGIDNTAKAQREVALRQAAALALGVKGALDRLAEALVDPTKFGEVDTAIALLEKAEENAKDPLDWFSAKRKMHRSQGFADGVRTAADYLAANTVSYGGADGQVIRKRFSGDVSVKPLVEAIRKMADIAEKEG